MHQRILLVQQGDNKEFRLTIPEKAKVTFAPFSPPNSSNRSSYRSSSDAVGTLRIYQGSKDNIIGMFTDVRSFRDLTSMEYSEKVATEEVSVVWKSDANGYEREEKVNRSQEWVEGDAMVAMLNAPKKASRKRG